MANKENLPPSPAFRLPTVHALSPHHKPILSRQRDHSTCRRPDTPLKVRKTRDNLKDSYNLPLPSCSHGSLACTLPGLVSASPEQHDTYDGREASVTTLLIYSPADDRAMTSPPSQNQRMQRHKSVSRRMLSKVKQGIRNRSQSSHAIRAAESDTSLIRKLSGKRKQSSETDRRAQSFEMSRDSVASHGARNTELEPERAHVAPRRSCTVSTVSTRNLSVDSSPATPPTLEPHIVSGMGSIPSSSLRSLSLSPTAATPRQASGNVTRTAESGSRVEIHVPFVELSVKVDAPTIDASVERDAWVAIAAIVRSRNVGSSETIDINRRSSHLGQVSNLRICFKPDSSCRVVEVVGQKVVKDLAVGQTCSLFVKVHVPSVVSPSRCSNTSQASLFAELESIVGTLEMDLLQVEVRYRHTLLPFNSVVTVRTAARSRRPNTESRWSLADPDNQSSAAVRVDLASHIASQYALERALRPLDQCVGADHSISDIPQTLSDNLNQETAQIADGGLDKPAVIVTDIDSKTSTPITIHRLSLSSGKSLADNNSPGEAQDDARKLWRHIRHSSLSAQRLADLTSDTLQHLEDNNDVVNDLRRQAIANKRSVGAETLRAWKWEEKSGYNTAAPWL